MRTAYTRIFTRMGLKFRSVQADSGAIGGSASEEFQVLAESGEDAIVVSDGDEFAANLELAAAAPPAQARAARRARSLRKWPRRDMKTIAAVSAFLAIPRERCLKTLLVDGCRRRRDRAGAAWRSRAQCAQGAEAAGSGHAAAHGQRRSGHERHRQRARASSGRAGLKCPVYADHMALQCGRLRLRRQ